MQDGTVRIINRLLDKVEKLDEGMQKTLTSAYTNAQVYKRDMDKMKADLDGLVSELDRVARLPVEEYKLWASNRIG